MFGQARINGRRPYLVDTSTWQFDPVSGTGIGEKILGPDKAGAGKGGQKWAIAAVFRMEFPARPVGASFSG